MLSTPPPVALAGAFFLVCASAAQAVDWSLSGFFSQRVSAAFEEDDAGSDDTETVRSSTDFGARVGARTKRTTWLFAPGVRGVLSSADDEDPELLPRFNGSVTHISPRSRLTGSVGVVPQFTDEARFEDTGVTERNAIEVLASASLGFAYEVDRRNALNIGANASARTYAQNGEGLDETRDVGVNAGWRVSLTPRTSASISSGARFFTSDGDAANDGYTFNVVAGLDHQINPRWTANASLGPSVSVAERRVAQPGGGSRVERETDFGVVGSAGVSYATPRTNVSASIDQRVDQNEDGTIENVFGVGAGVSHRLTSQASVSLNSALSVESPLFGGEESRQVFSLSPRFSIGLTDDWSLGAGYTFRAEAAENDDGIDVSNFIFLQVSRGLDFLP